MPSLIGFLGLIGLLHLTFRMFPKLRFRVPEGQRSNKEREYYLFSYLILTFPYVSADPGYILYLWTALGHLAMSVNYYLNPEVIEPPDLSNLVSVSARASLMAINYTLLARFLGF